MEREHQADAGSGRGSRFRIKSLMFWIGLVGLGLGWFLHISRVDRAFREDKTRFNAWAAEFEKAHPTFKPLGRSMSSLGIFFKQESRWNQDYRTPDGRSVSIQGILGAGPFSSDRRINFESPGRTVTWPFEDIERGRAVDLKAEFPGLFP